MTNIKQFPKQNVDTSLPVEAQHTEAYIMNEVLYSPTSLKSVPDIENGGQRNRRWGISIALAIVPQLDQMAPNSGPTILPKSPSRFFAADSLEELKARVVHELDRAMELAKMSVEDPEKFMKMQMGEYQYPSTENED